MSEQNDLKFTKTHEWIREKNGEYIVGITDHAQHLLGDLVFVELPEIGQEINQGREFGVVESVKAASDIYAPISGTVTDINDAIKRDPSIVNQDAWDAGWLIKIQAKDPNQINTLLNETQYNHEIAGEH